MSNQEVIILTKEQYKALEKQCPGPVPHSDTNPVEAGYLLGIQFVLKKLREGFTNG